MLCFRKIDNFFLSKIIISLISRQYSKTIHYRNPSTFGVIYNRNIMAQWVKVNRNMHAMVLTFDLYRRKLIGSFATGSTTHQSWLFWPAHWWLIKYNWLMLNKKENHIINHTSSTSGTEKFYEFNLVDMMVIFQCLVFS